MSDYYEKLKDPRWQKKRLKILERDKWQCVCCGDKENTLHVHHLIYTKSEPWDALDEHLETLCESCHEFRERFNEFGGGRSAVPTRFCYAFMRFSCHVANQYKTKANNFERKFQDLWSHVKQPYDEADEIAAEGLPNQ